MPTETDNPVRCERVFAGSLPELLDFLSGRPTMAEPAPPPTHPYPEVGDSNTEFLLGYLQGINSLSGHLLDVFSE